jgi:hypothetical protein
MWNRSLGSLALLTGAVVSSCGSVPSPSQPKPEAVDSQPAREPSRVKVAAAPKSEPEVAAETKLTSQPPASHPSDEPTGQRALVDLCAQICARAANRCSKQVAEFYATNCRRYAKAKQCETEITQVLECQLKTPDDLLCAHQADPNCMEANHQLQSCDKGTAPIVQTHPEDLTLPSDWVSINDSKLGFTVAMPKGAALEDNATKRIWKAQEGGITYLVATAEPPAGALTSTAILRTVMKYLGYRCQAKLKVHGEFVLKGVTVVQYESGCTDGTTWHGMMHFWNGNAVSTGSYSASGSSSGVLEPYFYSFAVTP